MKQATVFFLTISFLHLIATGQPFQPKKSNWAESICVRRYPYNVSVELGENRILDIYMPQHYSPGSSATYPVKMRNYIVVDIAHMDRRSDFTFSTTVEADKKHFPIKGFSKI